MSSFLQGVREGWSPEESCCSQECKEFLRCMTWVGRRAAKKFTELVAGKMDGGTGQYVFCLACYSSKLSVVFKTRSNKLKASSKSLLN